MVLHDQISFRNENLKGNLYTQNKRITDRTGKLKHVFTERRLSNNSPSELPRASHKPNSSVLLKLTYIFQVLGSEARIENVRDIKVFKSQFEKAGLGKLIAAATLPHRFFFLYSPAPPVLPLLIFLLSPPLVVSVERCSRVPKRGRSRSIHQQDSIHVG